MWMWMWMVMARLRVVDGVIYSHCRWMWDVEETH